MSKLAKNQNPNWRPDFCDSSSLPDIKVVRTNFLINFVAVTVALVLLFFVVQREYSVYSLKNTIDQMQQQLQADAAQNELYLKTSGEFRDQALSIIDLERFCMNPVLGQELIVSLVKLRPEGLIIKGITFSERVNRKGSRSWIEYNIYLNGEVKDPVLLDNFKAALSDSPLLEYENMKNEYKEVLQGRDQTTGIFPYSMTIIITPGVSNKEAKG